jgi:predicted nucleotidyltransferase component of viral defense system
LVGGNRTATFKVWYTSEILGRESFIKLQVNYFDRLFYKPVKGQLRSIISEKDTKRISLLFPEYKEYTQLITLNLYDIREIYAEKVRAILTRKGTKARDYVDIYMMSKNRYIDAKELEDVIAGKVEYMLKNYERYRRNFKEKKKSLNSGEEFSLGHEKNLLILQLDMGDFLNFVKDFTIFLKGIAEKIDG